MAEHFLYLTTKGWRTGEPRTIEIWFVELDGRHYIVSEKREESRWVKNLRQDPAVTFSVGTREDRAAGLAPTRADARPVNAAEEPDLARRVSQRMNDKYGWSDGLIVELGPV